MVRLPSPSRRRGPPAGALPLASVAKPLLVFAAASLVAVAVLGVAAIAVLRETARSDAIREAKSITRLVGEQIVAPALDRRALAGDRVARGRLDRTVRTSVLHDPIVRVKVWTLDGRIAYSDAPALLDRRFPLQAAERTAIRKRLVAADVSDLDERENRYERRFGKLLEVYLPIEAPDGERLLFEDYVRYSLVTDSEHAQLARFAPALAGALLLLWLVQLPFAASIVRGLRQRQREREVLLKRAIDSSEAERRRIAQVLHDGIVQELSGVSYSLAATERRLERDGDAATRRAVQDAASASRRAIAALRAQLGGIYPASVRRTGLRAALSELAEPLIAREIDVDVDVPADLQLSDATADTLFLGAQEALRNVARHAGSRHVGVRVDVADGRATLTVHDDGDGFDPDARPRSGGHHFGLRLLDDLVAERGGRLDVRSAAGKGTRVTLAVPVA